MLFLLLSIFTSALLVLLFKMFQKYNVNTFQAIVFNYVVAATLGFMIAPDRKSLAEITHQVWFINALLIGIMFISLFYLTALTAQKLGVSVSSAANKMSVVIPVAMAFLFYQDTAGAVKITGIFVAIIGVYLTSIKKKSVVFEKKSYYLPLALFIGSGLLDTYIKYTQEFYLTAGEAVYFVPTLFAVAAFSGLIILVYKLFIFPNQFQLKSLPWGLVLGVFNYLSIHFLIKTLQIEDFESSVIFPLNNVGILISSATASFIFFREKMSITNWTGIFLCVVAITLIAWADM